MASTSNLDKLGWLFGRRSSQLEQQVQKLTAQVEELTTALVKANRNALPLWLSQEAEAKRWEMPDPTVYENQAHLYRTLGYIGTAVDMVMNTAAGKLMEVHDGKGMEIENHPLLYRLDHPNPWDSRHEFLEIHWLWRKVTGNSYWWLNQPLGPDTPPEEIWILPPSSVLPVPDGKLGLAGYMYYPGTGLEVPLAAHEVIHFKAPNPFNRWLGLSLIESLASVAEGAKAAIDWNTRQFAENNARLPGILAFKNMVADPQWKKIKEDIVQSAAEKNHLLLRGVGDGVDWIQAAVSQREMEFLEGLDRSMREIYDRIAPGLYNILTANSSLANGQTGDLVFLRDTISPLLRATADKITTRLLPLYDGKDTPNRAVFEDVVPEDKAMKLAEISEYAKYHTVDEVRQNMYGDEPDADAERGKLFAAQITASSGSTQEPEDEVVDGSYLELDTEDVPAEEEPPVENVVEDELEENAAELKAELGKYQRRVLRAKGKPDEVSFTSEVIGEELLARIREELSTATDESSIKAIFKAHMPVAPTNPSHELAEAIRDALKVLHAISN